MKQHFWKVGLSGTVLAAALLGVGLSTAPKATQKAVATLNSALFGEKAYADTIVNTAKWGNANVTLSSDGVLTVSPASSGTTTLSGSIALLKWDTSTIPTIKTVVFKGKVYAPSDSSYLLGVKDLEYEVDSTWYSTRYNVSKISGLSFLDTSRVTNMTGMFSNLEYHNDENGFVSLDLSHFDTSKVTNMSQMFAAEYSNPFQSLDLSHFNTSNVTDMSQMFQGQGKLNAINLSSFNTKNVKTMKGMFQDVDNVNAGYYDADGWSLNLSNFNTSKVTDMSAMFSGISLLTNLNLSSFDTSKVTDMSNMFYDISGYTSDSSFLYANVGNLQNLNLSKFTTPSLVKANGMFTEAKVTNLNLQNFTASTPISADGMFNDANISNLNLQNFEGNKLITPYGNGIFADSNIQTITLGKYFIPRPVTTLADLRINSDTSVYTGNWQAVGSGTVAGPTGALIGTSQDFMNKYNGATMAGTYTWQPVNPDYSNVIVKNTSIKQNSTWNASANAYAINAAGKNIGLSGVKVSGAVNTKKTGTYTITYSYSGITKTATVTVVGVPTLNVKNTTIAMGTKWTAAQNFVSASTAQGVAQALTGVKVSGSVNTAKAGNYPITYSYAGITKTATVTVKNMTALDVKNVTYSQFGTWNNSLAFTSAKNASGAAVALSQVKVTGSVNTAKTGQYTLTYSYGGITKKAVISIVAPSIIYDTQVQGIGWQKDQNDRSTWFSDGQEAGTNGQSKRMESIKIALKLPNGMTGSVVYDAHVQNIGWQNAATPTRATSTPQTISPVSQWFSNGATAGTVGKALRMEAFTINLTGEIAKHYNVIYDSHVQNIGWQYAPNLYYQAPNFENPAPFDRWFKNGQEVGTNDHGLRMEALEIKLVAK